MINKVRGQFYKFNQWIKKKTRSWLFDEEYFIGADYGYHDNSIVIIRRNKRTGELTVIGDHETKDRYQKEFLMKITHFVKTYNVQGSNIVKDFPPGRMFF